MTAQATTSPSSQRWYYGPGLDLILGCGLFYAFVFVLLAFAGGDMRRLIPLGLVPLVGLFTVVPHYGATLLRVYERREDRRSYVVFSVFATALLWVIFVVGVFNDMVGSLFLTVYLTWSPWHYTGQNYGISLMFLRRRNVPVTPLTKRFIYATFILSFLLTALAIHSIGPNADYTPISYSGTVYHLVSLRIAPAVSNAIFWTVSIGYLAALVGAAAMLLRVAPLRDLGPAACIALTQALWFTIPVLARRTGVFTGIDPLSLENAAYAMLWVGVGHSIQYLWVTSYYASRSQGRSVGARYFLKTLFAGAAIIILPGIAFAPELLGRIPYDAGLWVMIASFVNLHHFVLDGAIWKLRDGRIARILVRGRQDAGSESAPIGSSRSWVRPIAWAVGALCVAVYAAGILESETRVAPAIEDQDLRSLERSVQRLSWIGRDSSRVRVEAAMLRAKEGDIPGALHHAEIAVSLQGTEQAWSALGTMRQRSGQAGGAAEAFREALRLRPDWPEVQNNLAWLLATHPASPEDAAYAVELAEKAIASFGMNDPNALDTLSVAYAAAGRFGEATRTGSQALRLARMNGEMALAGQISQHLALFRENRPVRGP